MSQSCMTSIEMSDPRFLPGLKIETWGTQYPASRVPLLSSPRISVLRRTRPLHEEPVSTGDRAGVERADVASAPREPAPLGQDDAGAGHGALHHGAGVGARGTAFAARGEWSPPRVCDQADGIQRERTHAPQFSH